LQHIATAIKKLIKKNGLKKGLDQQKAIDVWGEVVGENINQNTKPKTVEFGVLTVETENAVWRQELYIQKKNIIFSINKKLKNKIIKDIRFI
tara:strand:- start:1946 stop:2221 length:276 start_codon:yes stop_codon:yes gene_type:complete